MKKPRHHEVEHDEFEETRNATLLTKSYDLLDWVDNLEIGSPNLLIPPQIANYVGASPFCRFAITPRLDRIAIINFNRELNVYILDGDTVVQESRVQVLEEEFPEYCLLQYSDCGNLLLSTRSSAEIDIFDHSGGYCYGIQLETTSLNLDLRSAICCMKTIKNNSISGDDKYLDWLYVMQYNGTFSTFKIGRLSRYCPMWSCQLNIGLVNNFIILKEYNLLLVGAHYPVQGNTTPPGGLCSFRLIDEEPFVDPIRVLEHNTGWQSYLPFSSSQYAFICSMSLSPSPPHQLVCVSTNGDLFIYDLPSTGVNTVIKQFGSSRPIQAAFVDENEIAVIFNDGTLIRSEFDEIEKSVNEKADCEKYDGRAEISTPKARELFILVEKKGSGVHREIVSERTFLAARIWLYTIWSTLKSLIGMAVGDTPTPLQMVKHLDSYRFALYYLPTRTLQQMLDRTLNDKDYEGAKLLASSYDSININTILKREWMDINSSDSVTIDAVQNILKNISDTKWVAEACISCSSSNLEAQRTIAKLGMSLNPVAVDTRVRILHNARILAACPNVSFYLTHRSKSLLSISYELAKLGDVASLQRLLEKNFEILNPYLLSILTYLPPALPPLKYMLFLPLREDNLSQIKEERDSRIYEIESSLIKENPSLMYCVNFENAEENNEYDDYITWVRKRAIDIEEDTGLYNNSMQLLNLSESNGYKELDGDLKKWKMYVSYVKMCTAVSESFAGFWNRPLELIVSNISKLDTEQMLAHAEDIICLIEFRSDSEKFRNYIQSLLLKSCEQSTNVLKKFKELRPTVVDNDMITQCISCLSLTGKPLLNELRALSSYPELCSAIRALLDLRVTPTFQRLLDSTTDATIARSLLTQAIANMRVETAEEWDTLRDDVLHLADSIYHNLVPRVEVIQLLAKELLLNDVLCSNFSLLGTLLTLEKNGAKEFDGKKLGQAKSAEVLMSLSLEVMNNAVQKNDVNLDKSRFFATLARPILPKIASEQLKFLDAIDIMHDLGSTIMPATARLYDPMQILQEMVDYKSNYKKGKTLAKLATLLEIPTPVSTALSLASLVAIQREDEECLAKYIAEIMKARDIPIVHKLCMQIISSSYVPSALEDVYACALLNCPNDDLAETLNIIEENRRSKRGIISTLPDLSQEIVIDPSCSKVESYVRRNSLSESCCSAISNLSANVKPTIAARIWARESASSAIAFAIMNDENEGRAWTDNETLQRYEQALRHFLQKMTPALVENVPPKLLIERYNRVQGNHTPLDRIEMQGVNRERFITDAVYREDSLDGLSMTDDDGVFADAVALANQFHVDEWRLHMTSLENALTTCTPSEAKRILKTRGHLSKLRSNLEKFHSLLRSNVLPLLNTNDMFIAYLSLFSDDQPEKTASPILKKILERKKELKAKRLFTDPDYLTAIIISMPDKFIISFAEGLRKYPVGLEACDKAARILLDGTEIRPPASVLVLFALLGEDKNAIIDLIASKSLNTEIQYLENAAILLEASPNSPENLTKIIHERLELLKTPVETSSTPELPQPTFILTSRRRQ